MVLRKNWTLKVKVRLNVKFLVSGGNRRFRSICPSERRAIICVNRLKTHNILCIHKTDLQIYKQKDSVCLKCKSTNAEFRFTIKNWIHTYLCWKVVNVANAFHLFVSQLNILTCFYLYIGFKSWNFKVTVKLQLRILNFHCVSLRHKFGLSG